MIALKKSLAVKIQGLCLSAALGCLMAIGHPATAIAYVDEYVNCGQASCTIPDLKVGGLQEGTIHGDCTDIALPKITMKCYFKDESTSSPCKNIPQSTSQMLCRCTNAAYGPRELKGTVYCAAQ